ncbi:DUF6461 domain-containing protein [Streptomyces sp. PB17]|uniref:DUF6461 domain-containing protein n=1 Tax=Streptomyces sp. PB17 TaxID=3384158 RepID=UPI0038B64C00
MSDGMLWLPDSFSEGFCVAFCEGVSPEEFVLKVGGDPNLALTLTREQAESIDLAARFPDEANLEYHDLDEAELREKGFLRSDAEVIRVGYFNGWTFSLQSFGTFMSNPAIALKASRSSRFISFSLTVNMAAWVQYAVGGNMINSFDPLHPVAGPAEGLHVDDLEDAPAFATLAQLQERFHLAVPRTTDVQPLMTVALTR